MGGAKALNQKKWIVNWWRALILSAIVSQEIVDSEKSG